MTPETKEIAERTLYFLNTISTKESMKKDRINNAVSLLKHLIVKDYSNQQFTYFLGGLHSVLIMKNLITKMEIEDIIQIL